MKTTEIQTCFTSINSFKWKYEGPFGEFEVYVVTRLFREEEFRFLLGFDQDFPHSLPIIHLLNSGDKVENIPHLLNQRQICYLDLEGLIWDEENPVGIIEESVEMAFQTVLNSISGKADQDYLREFDHHWHEVQKSKPAISLVGNLIGPQLVVRAHLGKHQIIGVTKEQIKNYCNRQQMSFDQAIIEDMLYIPLTRVPRIRFKKPWNLSILRQVIFGNIGFKNRIRSFLQSNKQLPVYITMPVSMESRVHLGAEFSNVRGKVHPLLDDLANGWFQGLFINRMDKAYLLPRGGVRGDLSSKKVCLIGCGAIGSSVVQELAKAGITELLLIDYDKLSKDNLYRHVLGMPYIGQHKVKGLKDKLEKNLPHINITAEAKSFSEVVRQKSVDFSAYDLIIDATAVVNTSFLICRFFTTSYPGLPVLHTWLEALGIGGHAMVENNKGEGCYKCLYSIRDPEFGIYNRASFAAAGQSFGKSMFGCAGRFTPFSSLDAMRTATLAVELALKVLSDEEKGHPLLSWKGDAKYFIEAGYRLSDRYNNCSEAELYQTRYSYISETCPICTNVPV